MKIYLVRHGEAVGPDINPEMPLSPRGRDEVEKIGRFLGTNSFPLNLIIHSEKVRARETAEIMRDCIAPGLEIEEHPGLGPNDPIGAGLLLLGASGGDCMLVGHLPYLNKLIGHAVGGNEGLVLVNFQPGTTACLESSSGGWIINWVVGIEQV